MRTLDPTSQTTVILAAPQAQSAFAGEHPLVFELSRGASPALGSARCRGEAGEFEQVLVGLAPLIGAGRDDRLVGRQREARLDDRSIHGLAERVGFEPTVRLPVQRFSSSKILMLAVLSRN